MSHWAAAALQSNTTKRGKAFVELNSGMLHSHAPEPTTGSRVRGRQRLGCHVAPYSNEGEDIPIQNGCRSQPFLQRGGFAASAAHPQNRKKTWEEKEKTKKKNLLPYIRKLVFEVRHRCP